MARAGYTDSISLPSFSRCWIGEDKVEVTQPLVLGRSFLFDRTEQVVTTRLSLFGLTLSEEKISFWEIIIRLKSHDVGLIDTETGATSTGTKYIIEMAVANGRVFKVLDMVLKHEEGGTTREIERIVAAIRNVAPAVNYG